MPDPRTPADIPSAKTVDAFPRDVADAIANADAVLVAYEAPHFNESAP